MTADTRKSLPRRGTEPYAIQHAQQIASHWDMEVDVVRRGDSYFCLVQGMSLDGAELVGKTAAGGKMFVYHRAPAARAKTTESRCAG